MRSRPRPSDINGRGPRDRGRPLTRLAAATTAGHVFFELLAGVGMPLASWIGPAPAAGLWSTGTVLIWRRASSAPDSQNELFAAVNAVALAACLAHLAAWPRRRTPVGLPWLVDCEGLGPELMPAYNTVIYAGAIAAGAALVIEDRAATTPRPLVLLLSAPALAVLQQVEFQRLRDRARRRPAWWNRRLASR